jgi:peroxiredoxin Q/BCP
MRPIFWVAVLGFVAVVGCASVQRADGGTGPLPVGKTSSEVQGVDQNGKAVSLSSLRGKFVVVYFYPKDATPGCTKEACAFRDVWGRYQARNIEVIGVSNDDADSHRAFASDHTLPFSLIADTDRSWAKAFGISGVAGLYSRVTFVLAPDGRVSKVYEQVDPGVHAAQVLSDIEKLAAASGTAGG